MTFLPELDKLVNNPSLLNALFFFFWPVFSFISCLDASNPPPCSVPERTLLCQLGKCSGAGMCSRNFCKVLVLQGKEEFGLAGRFWSQQEMLSSLLDLPNEILWNWMVWAPSPAADFFLIQHFWRAAVPLGALMTLSNRDVPCGNLIGVTGIICWSQFVKQSEMKHPCTVIGKN